jgi:hypothetical protein
VFHLKIALFAAVVQKHFFPLEFYIARKAAVIFFQNQLLLP